MQIQDLSLLLIVSKSIIYTETANVILKGLKIKLRSNVDFILFRIYQCWFCCRLSKADLLTMVLDINNLTGGLVSPPYKEQTLTLPSAIRHAVSLNSHCSLVRLVSHKGRGKICHSESLENLCEFTNTKFSCYSESINVDLKIDFSVPFYNQMDRPWIKFRMTWFFYLAM